MKAWAYLLIVVAIPAACSKPEVSLPAAGNAVSAVEPPDDACEVVYLGKSAGLYMPLPPGPDRGFLVRELFRQALLISARDELGLATRDAWLGDEIPNEGVIRPFDLATRPGPAPQLEVLRGFPSSVKAIDAADLPSITTPDHYLKRLWVDAEKLSRTRLVEILQKSLGQRQPSPWNPDVDLPETIEDSLREMSFLAQFKGARQIHDLMATQGQSPVLLGALARTYANLGILTEFHWYPALAGALARRHEKAEQWDEAVRCYQAAIKVVGDKAMYESLADLYEKKGEENRWLETLEAALKLPDYGLDHAAIQKTIAWHFLDKKEWTRALPSATAAADCYSDWGLLCAAACYEGLEEWEKAEQYVRATADRYRSSAVGWYFFCRRTGHGDLQAARDLAQAYVDDPSAQDSRVARYDMATFYILEKQPDKALAIYREAFAELADPFFGLWVAILAEELRDTKTRDAALARIRTDGPSAVRKDIGRVRKELIELAGLIERDLAQAGQGQIDLKAVDKLRATIRDPYELGYFDLFLARYLQTHGKRDEAVRYWKERIGSSYALSYCRTHASAALRELGLTPESSKTISEKATPGDAKAAPEATKQGERESDKERKPEGTEPSGTGAKSDA